MWLVLTRAPRPDAPHWPGRRLFALADAVAWPAMWIVFALHLLQPAGIVRPVVIALAVLAGLGRMHRAVLQNHRYYFTTWRWGRVAGGTLLIGLVLKVAMT